MVVSICVGYGALFIRVGAVWRVGQALTAAEVRLDETPAWLVEADADDPVAIVRGAGQAFTDGAAFLTPAPAANVWHYAAARTFMRSDAFEEARQGDGPQVPIAPATGPRAHCGPAHGLRTFRQRGRLLWRTTAPFFC